MRLLPPISAAVSEVDPRTEPGDIVVRVFDEELGLEYDNERKLTAIVGLFALLAVVIALMGVFGLVLFETQHRRREIAVRRVMGASRGEILAMFNRRYVMLVAVCYVLAVPVSIWAVRHWLAGFAYAVPLLVGLCPGTGGGAGRHGTHRHRPLVACR